MIDLLFYTIIALILLDHLADQILGYYNNKWRSKPLPEIIKDVYSEEKYLKYRRYKSETYKFSIFNSTLIFFLTLLMLFFGFRFIDNLIREYLTNDIVISILFFVLIAFASVICQ